MRNRKQENRPPQELLHELDQFSGRMDAILEIARAEEREACAKIAEGDYYHPIRQNIAAAIRARGMK